jgi:hypothetical protein
MLFFLVVLWFELRASHLVDCLSTLQPCLCFCFSYFLHRVLHFHSGWPDCYPPTYSSHIVGTTDVFIVKMGVLLTFLLGLTLNLLRIAS